MNRKASTLLVAAVAVLLLAGCIGAANASADFGVRPGSFDGLTLGEDGKATTQAGGHPASVVTSFALNAHAGLPGTLEEGMLVPDGGRIRTSHVELPPGLIGNPLATPVCDVADFADGPVQACPDSTQIGIAHTTADIGSGPATLDAPVYNLKPPAGRTASFAFWAAFLPVYLFPTLRTNGDYGLTISSKNIDESAMITASEVILWGDPADSSHDGERGWLGFCGGGTKEAPCPSDAPDRAFLTNSSNCSHGPFTTRLSIESWFGATDSAAFVSHDTEGNPVGVTGCDRVPFQPTIAARLTLGSASTPTGLDFDLKMPGDGLLDPHATAEAPIKRAVIRLPEGVTVNPSSVEGIAVCSAAEFAREDVETPPGGGCPQASRLGSVDFDTPLLDERLSGSIYLAQPDDPATAVPGAENPFDSFLSMYLVARLPQRGVVVKLPGRIDLEPSTGQIVTTFDNLPQLPFTDMEMHLKGGARAPLASPPRCGKYTTVAELTPWSADDPSDAVLVESGFQVAAGSDGGACPTAAAAGFHPGFVGGSVNNVAGSFSPFAMRLTRDDAEQELTRFRAAIPEGVLARLRGVGTCPEAAVAAARGKSGKKERAEPSCPASSAIGSTSVGAGFGSVLTYLSGRLYLGGPFEGAPLSVVAVTPAIVGPFDAGTVVLRQALRVDPITAQVTVDAAASDPLPRILKGIKLNLRDLRIQIDRRRFFTTPTSCFPTRVAATVFGAGLDAFSRSDDVAADLHTRYQVSHCPSLGFKPKVSLKFSGATHRGAHPELRAVLQARRGEANVSKVVVTLPETEYLEYTHVQTVCTRERYIADNCPKRSIYGYAKAWSPLLDKPLRGPVYLRSSNHQLPDLVASLDGELHLDLASRVDSVKARIRNTFWSVPDAPLRKLVLTLWGGRKGLLVNNIDLCRIKPRARVDLAAHNGKRRTLHPQIRADCIGPRHP